MPEARRHDVEAGSGIKTMTQITDPTPGFFSFRSMFAVGALELQRAELNPTVMLHVDAATERPRFSCGKIENNDVTALAFLRSLTRSMTSQWDHPPTPHRPQIATVSECRYRWLRAPATTLSFDFARIFAQIYARDPLRSQVQIRL